MKKLKKLGATLFLITVATLGVCLTPQTARANCLATITEYDLSTGQVRQGFISCGSSAGNYIGFADGSSFTSAGVDYLCNEVGVC